MSSNSSAVTSPMLAAVLCLLPVTMASSVGCGVTYRYNETRLISQLPREDGSLILVECVSYLNHDIESISADLNQRPQVIVILDANKFVVHDDEVLLNGARYAELAETVGKVSINLGEKGCEVRIDGGLVEPLDRSLEMIERPTD